MSRFEAPITQVTVLEDRAYVIRRGRLDLPLGHSRWCLAGLSPVLADQSATARLSAGRLLALLVQRPPSAPPSDQRNARRAKLEGERLVLAQERASARQLAVQRTLEMAAHAASGRSGPTEWAQQWDEQDEWELGLAERSLQLEEELAQLEETERPNLQAELWLSVEATVAESVEVKIEYCVPGAAWRPYHVARLDSAGTSVEFVSQGCIWQNTGEDWHQVELAVSTHRPSRGSAPPKLTRDWLALQKKSSDNQGVAREEQIHSTGPPGPWTLLKGVPGVDDGGEVRSLKASAPCSVMADGRPTRVALFAFTVPTRLEVNAYPECALAVVQESLQNNQSTYPLLAGPVDLIRRSGLVGRTYLDYVAPQEAFRLCWGADTMLGLARRDERGKEERTDIVGGWIRSEHHITVSLSNLGQESREVVVTERIPVSEVKQVETTQDLPATTDRQAADENGFVRWTVKLAPRGRAELRLVYSLRRRKEVSGTP